jgi:gas vesicle protein
MSDSDVIKPANFAQKKSSASGIKEQINDAGAQMKQRAGEALQASTDAARDKLNEATDAAKEVASDAVDQIQGRAQEQQKTGADFIERLASNFREAAGAFESDVPFAARGIKSAADNVQEAAAKIRDGSFRDLVDGATDFAKRQPAAFLGISVLAGFAAIRFLKASGNSSSSQRRSASRATSSGAQHMSPSQGGSAS